MGVPAHDDRDFEFAQTYGLDIRVVVAPPDWDGQPLKAAYLDEGMIVDSGKFNGMSSSDALRHIAEFAETEKWGRKTVTYHLRDWLISRQRYWGTPIPIVYCPDCGTVPVPYEHLPVLLPDQAEFLPSGESPLKLDKEFVNVPCPRCGKPAERETDTMDTFVDSAWYHLRYTSPDEEGAPFDLERLQTLVAGAPVYGRRRARRNAPLIRAVFHKGASRPGSPEVWRTLRPPFQSGYVDQVRQEDIQALKPS